MQKRPNVLFTELRTALPPARLKLSKSPPLLYMDDPLPMKSMVPVWLVPEYKQR